MELGFPLVCGCRSVDYPATVCRRQTRPVNFRCKESFGHKKARLAEAGRALETMAISEGGAKLDRGTHISAAVQGANIQTRAENVQSQTSGELGIFFNTVV